MRAWLLSRAGGPEVLKLVDVPLPEPGPGDVVVRVEAIGINYAEVLSRKGLYGWAPRRPYVPGMEAVGTVERVGAGVLTRAAGERVICGMQHGAYAEYVVLPAERVLLAFDEMTIEENAAFAVNFMTAWVSLVEMARLRSTDRVGITAAAGGVGTAAVQIARAHGCRVLGMAGSSEKLERIRTLGVEDTVNYRSPDFLDRLDEAVADGGLDVVLEVVGGDVYRACFERLSSFGRIVVAGYASLDYSWWNPWSWWRAWRDAPRLSIRSAAVASTGALATHIGFLLSDEDRVRATWTELCAFVRAHQLRPLVGEVYDFESLPEAHRFLESRRSVGKLVVRLG